MVQALSVVLIVWLCLSRSSLGAQDQGVLLDTRPLERIQIVPGSDETTRFAAEELQKYLKQISGVQLPIVVTAETDRSGVVLSAGADSQGMAELGDEGFSIRTSDRHVFLAGACPRALLYAVYAFLEHLGCRWCFPAAAGEVVPRCIPLNIPTLDVKEKPSFSYRTFQHCAAVDQETIEWIDWMAKNRMNRFMITLYPAKGYKGQWYREFKAVPGLLAAIRKRGILVEAGHHSLYYWLPPEKHFDEHPEWYSMIAGKRPRVSLTGKRTQLCFSNSGVAEAVAQRILAFVRENPEADVISIYTNDGYGYCECPECGKAETPADAYVQFVNRVAKAVHLAAPDKRLSMLSYSTVSAPPRSRVFDKNTLCAVATWPPPDENRLRGWLKSGVGEVALYEYYMGSYSDRSLPGCWTGKIAEELRTIHGLGLAGMATQCELANWGSYSLNYYVCARLLWNVKQPLEDVIGDYLQHYYGPAASAMGKYFQALERQGRMKRDVNVPEALLKEMDEALQAAQAKAGDDATLEARIARDRLSFRYLRQAWEIEKGKRDIVAAVQRGDRKAALAAATHARDTAAACVKLLLDHKADRVFLAGAKEIPHEIVGYFYTTRYYESERDRLQSEIDALKTRPMKRDLALNKPADASSEYAASCRAGNAVDGRMDTAWWSAYSPSRPATHRHALPQWLRVDLGDVQQVGAVVLRTPKQVYHYRVEVSVDGKAWELAAEKTDDVKGSLQPGLTHAFNPRAARYVRVTVTKNPKNAAHICELEVYGDASEEMEKAMQEQELEEMRKRVANKLYAHLRAQMAKLPAARITEDWPKSADEWAAHVPRLREQLEAIFHFPPERCELAPKKVGEIELNGLVIEKLLYQSEPLSLVTANVYRPANMPAGRLPALILPSGHGGSKSSPYNQYMGQMYAKAGCVVLAFDPIGEEERDEKGRLALRGHRVDHRIDRCLAMGRSTIGKMVYDAVRGIDYLVSRPDVDPQRLACSGHSLGGTLTEYVTAIDERVRVSMPTAWTCNFKEIVGELSCCWRPFGLLHAASDPELFAAAAPRCTVLVLAGGRDACPMHVDRFMGSTLPAARRVFGLFGDPERMAVHVTPGAHHEPFQLNRAALLWMEEHLGLPKWSRADVEALPELTTTQSVCAKLGSSKALAQAEIERLVKAHGVDCGVELLPPEQLRCVSPTEWPAESIGMASWFERVEAKAPGFSAPATAAEWANTRPQMIDAVRTTLCLPKRDARVTAASQPREDKRGRTQELTFGTLGLTSILRTPDDVAPPWPCVLYLDGSRTAIGATARMQAWLEQGQAVLALDCVPFDDTAVLLGTSSTAYNVAHVLEAVDVLAARPDIDAARLQCVSAVDDVGLLATALDERIRELVIESTSGTNCSFQGYRLNGIVPGLAAVATRARLLSAIAPRRLTVCTMEDARTVESVKHVFRLLGAGDGVSFPPK